MPHDKTMQQRIEELESNYSKHQVCVMLAEKEASIQDTQQDAIEHFYNYAYHPIQTHLNAINGAIGAIIAIVATGQGERAKRLLKFITQELVGNLQGLRMESDRMQYEGIVRHIDFSNIEFIKGLEEAATAFFARNDTDTLYRLIEAHSDNQEIQAFFRIKKEISSGKREDHIISIMGELHSLLTDGLNFNEAYDEMNDFYKQLDLSAYRGERKKQVQTESEWWFNARRDVVKRTFKRHYPGII
jgi:hypothetical protein